MDGLQFLLAVGLGVVIGIVAGWVMADRAWHRVRQSKQWRDFICNNRYK